MCFGHSGNLRNNHNESCIARGHKWLYLQTFIKNKDD